MVVIRTSLHTFKSSCIIDKPIIEAIRELGSGTVSREWREDWEDLILQLFPIFDDMEFVPITKQDTWLDILDSFIPASTLRQITTRVLQSYYRGCCFKCWIVLNEALDISPDFHDTMADEMPYGSDDDDSTEQVVNEGIALRHEAGKSRYQVTDGEVDRLKKQLTTWFDRIEEHWKRSTVAAIVTLQSEDYKKPTEWKLLVQSPPEMPNDANPKTKQSIALSRVSLLKNALPKDNAKSDVKNFTKRRVLDGVTESDR